MDRLKSILKDRDEKILAVLGKKYAEQFAQTGAAQNSFVVMTDKNLYFIKKESQQVPEETVELYNIHSLKYSQGRNVVYKVFQFVCLGQAIYECIAMIVCLFIEPIAAAVFAAFAILTAPLVLVFRALYERSLHSSFTVYYIRGKFALERDAVSTEEAEAFQAKFKEAKALCKRPQFVFEIAKKEQSVLEEDVPEELGKYKALLEQGILTQAEFEQKKKQLLNLN